MTLANSSQMQRTIHLSVFGAKLVQSMRYKH